MRSFLAIFTFRASPFASAMHQCLMDASLASLSESFSAPIDFALKWFLTSVSKIMLNKVLLKSKMFPTLVADPFFVNFVYFHVSLEAVFSLEDLVAA
jgi:hypothetical protein